MNATFFSHLWVTSYADWALVIATNLEEGKLNLNLLRNLPCVAIYSFRGLCKYIRKKNILDSAIRLSKSSILFYCWLKILRLPVTQKKYSQRRKSVEWAGQVMSQNSVMNFNHKLMMFAIQRHDGNCKGMEVCCSTTWLPLFLGLARRSF